MPSNIASMIAVFVDPRPHVGESRRAVTKKFKEYRVDSMKMRLANIRQRPVLDVKERRRLQKKEGLKRDNKHKDCAYSTRAKSKTRYNGNLCTTVVGQMQCLKCDCIEGPDVHHD